MEENAKSGGLNAAEAPKAPAVVATSVAVANDRKKDGTEEKGGVEKKSGVEKRGSGAGLKVVVVVMAVVAACGVGFGIYGMLRSSEKGDRVSELEAQIAELEAQVEKNEGTEAKEEATGEDEEAEEKEEVTENGGGAEQGGVVVGGPYIEKGYFYVPEWGLKFKIPSDLANYGYAVDYDEAHVGYSQPAIGFTAMLKSDVRKDAQMAYYDDIQTCAIVSVTKERADWNTWGINGVIREFDGYKLLIWNYSRHGSCDYNLHIDQVQEKLQAMFSRPEAM